MALPLGRVKNDGCVRYSANAGSADHHAEDLAMALVVDRDGQGHRDRDGAPGLAHLPMDRVEPEMGLVALHRPLEEVLDSIVDLATKPGELGLGDAGNPHRLHHARYNKAEDFAALWSRTA